MDKRRDDSPQLPAPPRRFVYRSAQSDSAESHPLRRWNDQPQPFRGVPGQLCSGPVVLKFRVYLKVN